MLPQDQTFFRLPSQDKLLGICRETYKQTLVPQLLIPAPYNQDDPCLDVMRQRSPNSHIVCIVWRSCQGTNYVSTPLVKLKTDIKPRRPNIRTQRMSDQDRRIKVPWAQSEKKVKVEAGMGEGGERGGRDDKDDSSWG